MNDKIYKYRINKEIEPRREGVDMKKTLKLTLICISLLIFVGSFFSITSIYSFPQGISGKSESGCGGCHGSSASQGTSVTITGLPGLYEPSKNYSLTIEVTSTDVPGNDGGFDLSVTAGTLVVTDTTNTQLKGGDLTHTDAGWHQRSWSFNWTAPTGGSVTFYVAGLAADGDASANGDTWNTYSVTLDIIPEFTSLTLILVLAAVTAMVLFFTKKKFTSAPLKR